MIVNKLDRRAVVRLAFLLLILCFIILMGTRTAPWLVEHIRNPEYIRKYIDGYGDAGFLVFILIQMIQVIIVIIPVDLINVCAGYVFGIPLGFILSFTGLMLGTVVVFYISRFFGYELVSRIVSRKKIEKINGILNSTTGTISLFLICCIPLIPKDVMMYVAGLTPVKASRLFLVYGISRIPTTLIWVSVGANAYEKDIQGIGIILGVMLILLVVVFFLGRYYHKRETQEMGTKI